MAELNNEGKRKNSESIPPMKGVVQSKKRLNIVFRRQNSSSIKDLPEALKSHVENNSQAGSDKKNSLDGKTSSRRPRPLPAGTKPVKPMAGKVNERSQDTLARVDAAPGIVPNAKTPTKTVRDTENSVNTLLNATEAIGKFVTEKVAHTITEESDRTDTEKVVENFGEKAAKITEEKTDNNITEKTDRTTKEKIDKTTTEKATSSDKDIKELKQKNIDNISDENIKNKEKETNLEKSLKEEEVSVEKGTEKSSVKKPKKALDNVSAKRDKKTNRDLLKTKIPEVRVVKSYANYDAAKVIAEASKRAKRENRKGGFGTYTGETKDQTLLRGRTNPRTNDSKKHPDTNGTLNKRRTFADNKISSGSEPYKSSLSQQNKKSSSRQTIPAGSFTRTDRRGQFPLTSNRGEQAGKTRGGRAQYAARKGKKDKFVEEFPRDEKQKAKKGAFIKPEPKIEKPEEEIKVIVIPETLTIKELSDKMHIQPSAIVKKMFLAGKMVTPNTDLSYEEAEEIALEYNILCEKEVEEDVMASLLADTEDPEDSLVLKNPVICVMGHVDHGKTSLLDAIRHTDTTSHEAGGITQHIGASVVKVGNRYITFLDTPGHEAFTAMRLRGAQATDIAVLVVAADDGVKPQTVEAINHAKAAGVTVIVAINKMDKIGASPELVKKELSDYDLIPEDWGGNTPMVEVSAKTGSGIRDLLDIILLQADIMELKANPNRLARGLVIEASLDKGRGPVATVLVQKGTLKVGDYVAAGTSFGRVRAMFDDKRETVKKVAPSYPAEILGLSEVPEAGEIFMAFKNERDAKAFASAIVSENKKHMLKEIKKKMNLDELFNEIKAGNVKELPIIIKADVQGSVEALKQSLVKLSNEEVAVNVIHQAPGNINESDVSLASASNAVIIGFNVKIDPQAKVSAQTEKVDIRLYNVIYQVIDDLEAALTGMLAPVYEPQVTGHAIIRQIFRSSGVGNIAGCYVTDGVVERDTKAKLFRGDKMIFDGDIASLKRFKDEVKEVKLGFECGIVLEDFSDLKVDDSLEVYKMVQVPRN